MSMLRLNDHAPSKPFDNNKQLSRMLKNRKGKAPLPGFVIIAFFIQSVTVMSMDDNGKCVVGNEVYGSLITSMSSYYDQSKSRMEIHWDSELAWPFPQQGQLVPTSKERASALTRDLVTGRAMTYNSLNHPKAHGLEISLKYPNSWTLREGNRPHILAKIREAGHGEMIMISVYPLEELDLNSLDVNDYISSYIIDGAEVFDYKYNQLIDGISAASIDLFMQGKQLDVTGGIYMRIYALIYDDCMVQVQFSVMSPSPLSSKSNIIESFKNCELLFKAIANSIVIHNQWKK